MVERWNPFPSEPDSIDVVAASDYDDLLAYVDALRAAAGKVTCANCVNEHWGVPRGPCPDCADLRRLMGEKP